MNYNLKNLAIFLFATTLFISCESDDIEVPIHETENTKENVPAENSASEADASFTNIKGELQLNNGKKWMANEETTSGVNKMIAQIAQYEEMQLPEDAVNYNMLAQGINTTMDGIFAQCTMKGAAHDELHDFLVPIFEYSKTLEGDDVSASKEALADLKAHLAEYKNYFI